MGLVRIFSAPLFLLAASSAAPIPAMAAEGYDTCTGFIDSVPATIATQGTWCLRQDLSTAITSGSAITIAVNNVTLDCNDFKIGGLGAGVGTQARGVYAASRTNTTIRNCRIRGFLYGVDVQGGSGHTIEDNRFDANTRIGIMVGGADSLVHGNVVRDTGLSTAVPGGAYGILSSYETDIIDNTIISVSPTADAGGYSFGNGIRALQNYGGRISNNRVSGVSGINAAIAINTPGSALVSITGNQLVGDGASNSVGIDCGGFWNNARVLDNVVNGFAVALNGQCRDDGNSL